MCMKIAAQIGKLEQELRTCLFYRHGRGVSLTESGRKLSDVVRPMLQQLIEVKEDMLEKGDRPSGVVALGVPPSIGNTLVEMGVLQKDKVTWPAIRDWLKKQGVSVKQTTSRPRGKRGRKV